MVRERLISAENERYKHQRLIVIHKILNLPGSLPRPKPSLTLLLILDSCLLLNGVDRVTGVIDT